MSAIMQQSLWKCVEGDGPLVAVANHDGHELRDEVAALCALPEDQRLQEEDPYTGAWAVVAPTRVVAKRSRFEVDLNRSRGTAVYRTPEDAWGLTLWRQALPQPLVERSLADFDAFYAEMQRICSKKSERFGAFFVFDLHTYNHRREGPDGPDADPDGNPEINVGTGTMERGRWASLVDRFINDLRAFDFLGRHLDVRENVKFVGRQFPLWTHTTFPESGCALAIEVKKFFMNEWTGVLDVEQHTQVLRALESTVPGILDELERLRRRR